MKVWLDDVREPPDRSWVWVKTSAEALTLLWNGHVEQIALDFDLGGEDTALSGRPGDRDPSKCWNRPAGLEHPFRQPRWRRAHESSAAGL